MSQEIFALVENCALRARDAARSLAVSTEAQKNSALETVAQALLDRQEEILAANSIDMENGRAKGLPSALLDRLLLTSERIDGIAQGVREIISLPDPVGEITELKPRPSGIKVGKMRVPLGVVGMIYEARPNVTVDAAALCLKAGNSVLLRGGTEAYASNSKLAEIIAESLQTAGMPKDAAQLIPTTDRASIRAMATMDKYIDVLIARGGEKLIEALAGATVPLFKHGKGICHTYIDSDADINKAIAIAVNAKVSRPGVCNAMETLLVHKDLAGKVLPEIGRKMQESGVELVGDPMVCELIPNASPATEADWATEYLSLKLSVRVVDSFLDAVSHIHKYGSLHSEAIITENHARAMRFLESVDAAAVFVNASTRFNDGGQFGLGAEIGISTQKLHARGPMGIRELTTTKFVVFGNGEVR